MLTEFVVVVVLILVNGVFAAAEIAIVSLRRTRLQQLVEEGRAGAAAVAALRAHPERFLATVQIGITVVGATAAAFGGYSIAHHLEPALEPVVDAVPGLAGHAEEVSLGIVVAVISYLSLVLGELVPKSLALRGAEFFALLLGRPLQVLAWLARPLVRLLTISSNVVLRPFSDRTNFIEARISTEELQQMVEEATEAGALNEHAGEIASRALEFDKLTLRDVMVPRGRVDALPVDAGEEQVREFLIARRRSRIPVYEGTMDNVLGYVSAKDVIAVDWEKGAIVLRDLLRPAKVFPESVPAIDVLRFLQREHVRLAVAVDEHGALSGLVTFDDMVEELVGEVFSEDHDMEAPFVTAADGTVRARGDTPVRELNRELDLELPEGPDFTTVGGLCVHLAAGIPNRGARLAAGGGVVLVVEDSSPRAVRRVRVLLPQLAETVEPEPPGAG